ncbi:MAG: hypothetical protein HRU23_10660 [Gammaproteobacteria bacterium]|nr:hypothetical protein [Gammaproteobacteria bacterium]
MLVVKLLLLLLIILSGAGIEAASLSDPTRPGIVIKSTDDAGIDTAAPVQVLRLDAIQTFNNNSIAVISGKPYQSGQAINQDVILKIMFDKVIFSSGTELYLFGNSVVNISK